LKRLVGKTLPVLVEGPHPETELLLVGRLSTQAPEVDGTAIITKGMGDIGRIMFGRVTASHDYDLEVELLSEGPINNEG
jgi:ribosomal protein S12 methylthiotransferase